MRIAIDAMGGDLGPEEVVRGVVDAARLSDGLADSSLVIVGKEEVIQAELTRLGRQHPPLPPSICVHPATQVIEMTDKPREAYRKKPDASVVVAARLVRDGEADAFISIGNTGAAMAASIFLLRPLPGIDRPAIATPLPSLKGQVVLLDAGANVDCTPRQLLEFAVMGRCYAQKVIGIPNPSMALLSNGEEASKGNDLTKQAHVLIKDNVEGFVGNIEGREVFRGTVNVVVCDGFNGNILLKTGEGVAEMVIDLLKEELTRNKWMKPFIFPFRKGMRRLRDKIDYREFGGAPLLGVNGICIIGHGRSDARAIVNAIRVAQTAIRNNLIEETKRAVSALQNPS